MVLSIIAAWVIQFPLAYVLSRHTSLGLNGLWWAYPISMVISAVASVLWFIGGDWKRTKLVEELELERLVSEEARGSTKGLGLRNIGESRGARPTSTERR